MFVPFTFPPAVNESFFSPNLFVNNKYCQLEKYIYFIHSNTCVVVSHCYHLYRTFNLAYSGSPFWLTEFYLMIYYFFLTLGSLILSNFTSKKSKIFILFVFMWCALCLVARLHQIPCNPLDCSLLDSSVHGDSLGKNAGVGSHVLLQGIFPT